MRIRGLFAATALAVTTCLTAGVGISAPAAQAATNPPVLFGLIDHWEPQVTQDVRDLGVRPGIIGTFASWTADPVTSGWMRWADWVRAQGAAPMFDLMPPSSTTLGRTAAGYQDANLVRWARAFRNWGHPVLFRLYPEMNATESYRPGTRGQTTRQFVLAWRHIWLLFHGRNSKYPTVKAPDVKFVWNPYRPYTGSVSLAKVWPGAGYVDWLALDIYNFHSATRPSYSAYDLTKPAIDKVRLINKTKPLFLAELGCAQYAGKPRWISRAYPALQGLGVKAAVSFNETSNLSSGYVDWRYQSSSTSLSAARTVLRTATVVHAPSSVSPVSSGWLNQIDNFVRTGSL